jgi:hypothetical protein
MAEKTVIAFVVFGAGNGLALVDGIAEQSWLTLPATAPATVAATLRTLTTGGTYGLAVRFNAGVRQLQLTLIPRLAACSNKQNCADHQTENIIPCSFHCASLSVFTNP